MNFSDQLQTLSLNADQKLKQAQSLEEIEFIEVKYLGRKGELTTLLKQLAEAPAQDRPKLGAQANEIKNVIADKIARAKQRINGETEGLQLSAEREDVTEPGLRPPSGHLHIVTQAIREITEIFHRAGFSRAREPEVEWDWYAFEALNMPKDHPARDEWETFFMDAPVGAPSGSPSKRGRGRMILTPHSTNGTARTLAEQQPPIRSINISKCYRRQIDVTHVPMFHQFDGVYVDQGVAVTHLVGILDYFVRQFFGPERRTRIRPFHFRFTEPSFEVDVSCGVCGGTGCRTCKRGWLELGGAGMLHPNVLKAAGMDPSKYSGLAFGWGVERTFMMKEGMQLDDIRLLYKNDLRFLQQF